MKLKPESLSAHLKNTLLQVYCISGDEPLLTQEALDALRQACQNKGFSERHTFTVDTSFDISTVYGLTQSMSLFGDRKRIELKLPGKCPAELSDFLKQCSARPLDDTILILITSKLDGNAQKSAWYKAIDDIGAHIAVWPIETKQLPAWIQTRARQAHLQFDQNALLYLSECVEGNLLAAAQWIEKLSIQFPSTKITEAMVESILEDSSRYDVFELISCWLLGNQNKAWHILQKLQLDAEPTIIVWAMAKDIRTVYQMTQQKQVYIWPKRQGEFDAALRRFSPQKCQEILQQLAKVDAMIKGGISEDPWIALHDLCVL